jgi:hypothetical protein
MIGNKMEKEKKNNQWLKKYHTENLRPRDIDLIEKTGVNSGALEG